MNNYRDFCPTRRELGMSRVWSDQESSYECLAENMRHKQLTYRTSEKNKLVVILTYPPDIIKQ